jgi:molybdopterin synthase catalytic subunit
MIQLTHQPIDTEKLVASVRTPEAGAVVLFLGIAREHTQGRRTQSLDYEAYGEMAARQLAKLESEACRRWPIARCAIVHRLGHLELAETSVGVAVSTPHRQDAFEAAKWLIDAIKRVVPIWKKENWADGTSEWVHPGTDSPAHDAKER